MTISIRTATPLDFQAIAQLIHHQCANPALQCIQSSTGESSAELVLEMEKSHASGEMVWAVGLEEGALAGVMGCEFDREAGRGWLRGPFAVQDFNTLADRLLAHVKILVPKEITRFDAFLNAENERGLAFYAGQGFIQKGKAHVYEALASDYPGIPEAIPKVQSAISGCQIGFEDLHEALFAGTLITGKQIAGKINSDHRVWLFWERDRVLGYLYGVIEEWSDDGYIEFLGVEEKARGRGIGGMLLLTALDWFFNERGVRVVGLNVDDRNTNARGLYERVGFRLKYTGVNQRWEV